MSKTRVLLTFDFRPVVLLGLFWNCSHGNYYRNWVAGGLVNKAYNPKILGMSVLV